MEENVKKKEGGRERERERERCEVTGSYLIFLVAFTYVLKFLWFLQLGKNN